MTSSNDSTKLGTAVINKQFLLLALQRENILVHQHPSFPTKRNGMATTLHDNTRGEHNVRFTYAFKGVIAHNNISQPAWTKQCLTIRSLAYDKEDFVGRNATLKVKQEGVVTQLVYVEIEPGTTDIHGGEPVFINGRTIGVTTSGGYAHHTARSLGFAYVEPEYAAPGSKFEIDVLGQSRAGTVLSEPVYDPTNDRLRA